VNDHKKTLIAYRLQRARETLEEARLLLDAGHVNACVNRLYYACFYAVSALLMTRNVSTSRHAHLRSLLHRDYVGPGHISAEMGKHFDLLFDSRQEGDYADLVVFDGRDVEPWLERTESFVDCVAQMVARAT
jgi:uncharacterized protein (UPF0332 family)